MQKEIVFHNQAVRLTGTLTLPDGAGPFSALALAHASHAPTRDYAIYQHVVECLTAQGLAVFCYDRRGSGESSGDFTTASFYDLAGDLEAAVAALKQHPQITPERIGVWGLSQGGWIAPLAASRSLDIAFVVAVSAAGVTPAEQMAYSAVYMLMKKGFSKEDIRDMLALASQVNAYYRGDAEGTEVQKLVDQCRSAAWFEYSYIDEVLPPDPQQEKWFQEMDFDPLPVFGKVDVPVLLLYAEEDPWVPIVDSMAAWKKHKPSGLTVHQIEDANHFMCAISQVGLQSDTGPVVEKYTDSLVEWLKQQK